jgi:hypothetical protein
MAQALVDIDGSSGIAAHAATYHSITLLVKCVMVVAASLLSFLIVGFAANAGFFAGLIAGLVVLAAGTFALRHGWAHSSEGGSLA